MADIDQKLDLLYDLLVDNVGLLKTELIDLIAQPDKIKYTNRFASLLTELKDKEFIAPLLLQISLATENRPWLTDYLYAAANLLEESSADDEFDVPDGLVNKLGSWIIDTTGELSWKAASLLKFLGSASAEKVQLQKLEERGDFFLTYVECILGLLRYHEAKHTPLVKGIAADDTRDGKLRAFCREIIEREH